MTESAPRRGHQCPPSQATHPRDRWETLFVYSFIVKFTNLKAKVEGFEGPADLEDALLSQTPNTIMVAILSRFVLNLRPQTRNLSQDQILTTVGGVVADFCKNPERTIFWDEGARRNVDPFSTLETGFWASSWDFKLGLLRQLVELQLCHATDIKATIDRAWGVQHNKHKKRDASSVLPDPSDPDSREALQLTPLGTDASRKRYWTIDSSPRIYVSTNPWKMSATFETVASTRDEYVAAIEKLKSEAPPKPKGSEKRPRYYAHMDLVRALEERLDVIDAEVARIQKARRKAEQRSILLAQAELRQTRTRRQTKRPDYVYSLEPDEDDGADDYKFQEDEGYDDDFADDFDDEDAPRSSKRRRGAETNGTRRSARTAVINGNSRRSEEADPLQQWRGERRSTRLGAPPEMQLDEAEAKRARTEDSMMSSSSSAPDVSMNGNGHSSTAAKPRASGAAALRPSEAVIEQLPGKKKSRFWFYAVEPVASQSAAPPQDVIMSGPDQSAETTPAREAESLYDESMEESPSS